MEPLKKIQVEGFAMFAEPELLFGNLDELCCVSILPASLIKKINSMPFVWGSSFLRNSNMQFVQKIG
jgi:hypothetical protein